MRLISVSPETILPSQDFLKPSTIQYILDCLQRGATQDLPPAPIVRQDPAGRLVAIDGHNIIATRFFRREPVVVLIASSSTDGLPATTEANNVRNAELAERYETALEDRRQVAAAGILTFADLVAANQAMFYKPAA